MNEAVRLYSLPAAGERLGGVSGKTVERLINDGDIRSVDIGRAGRPRKRVRADDLQAFIDARTSGRTA